MERTSDAALVKLVEFPTQGRTYRREVFGVYEYGTYGRSSVLAGQERRIFVGTFATLMGALKAHPDAEPTQDAIDEHVRQQLEEEKAEAAGNFVLRPVDLFAHPTTEG